MTNLGCIATIAYPTRRVRLSSGGTSIHGIDLGLSQNRFTLYHAGHSIHLQLYKGIHAWL